MNAVFVSLVALLSLLLIISGGLKLRSRREFAAAVVSWGFGPVGRRIMPVGLPVCEVLGGLFALGLLAIGLLLAAALLLAATFSMLTAGQVAVLLRTRNARCGCFGRNHQSVVGGYSVARDLGLAAIPAMIAGVHVLPA